MKSIVVTAIVAACILIVAACEDKSAHTHVASSLTSEESERYYAFKLKAFREPYGRTKVRQQVGTRWQDVEMQVAVRFEPGSADPRVGRDNPYINMVNMDDPSACLQVQSRYDPDVDLPIYVQGKAHASYRQRLQFHAVSSGDDTEPAQELSFQWYWGKKFSDYGVMKRFTLKRVYHNKSTVYFLTEKMLKLSPEEISSRYFNAVADETCQQASAAKNITRPPMHGIWHYAFTLPQYKGAGPEKKMQDTNKKLALRLELSPTKGGNQYARVIVKDMNKSSTCYVFNRHALTLDWKTHNDKLYHKHISIAKRYGDSDRYFMINWVLDNNKKDELTYFYLDDKVGGSYYEYVPAKNLALSLPPVTLTSDEIAQQYFPPPDHAKGCSRPEPKHK